MDLEQLIQLITIVACWPVVVLQHTTEKRLKKSDQFGPAARPETNARRALKTLNNNSEY